ncbi:MAG: ABC transporter substrate-binding protein [Alphaproteobacteria bacterium]|nr:ABC transporter substrate-binding protein [Alphaproteobacteria bacterium]
MAPLTRRTLLAAAPAGAAAGVLAACRPASPAADAPPLDWPGVERAARGQTVRWSAWAGDQKINAFIEWVGQEVSAAHGIRLEHLKTDDPSSGVTRLRADKTAGRSDGGAIDLLWINGENFAAARAQNLLYGPFAERLPNFRFVDRIGKPSTVRDFTLPTDGYESPWGMAQITFFHDAARLPAPPRSVPALLDWAKTRRGRFTYPAPGDFVGVSFLKQVLSELIADRAVLAAPVEPARFAAQTAPLWAYLDALHPHLWRSGRAFPPDYPGLMRLLEDTEVDLAFAFNPAEAATAVAAGRLPTTTRAFTFEGGTIANTHFVAIPFNATAKAAAMVVANVLLSPRAQARKADPAIWGDPTVLALDSLAPAERAAFDTLAANAALPSAGDLARTLPEPHPTWHIALGQAWRARYAA